MADNATAFNSGAPVTFATDDIGGEVQAPRMKIMLGGDGVDGGNVSSSNPIPIMFDPSNLSAFGDLVTSELSPILQIGFTYGLLSVDGAGTTSGTGATVDTSNYRLRVQSGTTANTGSAIYKSKKPCVYREGQGMTARFTGVFEAGVVGNVQEIGAASASDGYCFGYNGATFGILHRNSSTGSLVETWTGQGSFNGTVPSGFNPLLGNVYMIRYPYLGFGDVLFFIMDSVTGRFILSHTIRYANSSVNTQASNPTLYFWARSANTGANTKNKTLYCGSAAVFLNGILASIDSQFGADNNKASITTETSIIAIRNCATFNGVANGGVIKLRSMSFGGNLAGGNPSGIVTVRIKTGSTLGGTPAYTARSGTTADNGVTITNGQSITSFDTAGTTVTGGTIRFNATANMNSGYEIDLLSYDININPNDIAIFSIQASTSCTGFVTVNWKEDV